MRTAAVRVGLCIVGLFAGGCWLEGRQCTEEGCISSVTLEFTEPLTGAGEYVFSLSAGDKVLTCRATVPLPRDGSVTECIDEGAWVNREELTEVSESGDVRGRSGDAITSVSLLGEHSLVSLTVTRDEVPILSTQVAPQYEYVEINGEGCGTCPTATEVVDE